MFRTKITEMFGIKHPIIVGAMMHISNAEMVAAASNAGALGVLASAMFPTGKNFRDELKKTKDLTDQPFAVNINMFPAVHPVDNMEILEICGSEGVHIIETSGHKAPEEFAGFIKDDDMLLVHKCVGIRYALKAQSIGADVITAIGYENGGATGTFDITTLCLVPRMVDILKVPVIGGGGVADGRGFLSLLALGAQGVIMGTAFLVAEECPIHNNLKRKIIEGSELDTIVVMRSIGNSHRVLKTAKAEQLAQLDKNNAGLDEILKLVNSEKTKEMYKKGYVNASFMSCGQGMGLVKKIRPIREIIGEIINQADELRSKLSML